MTVEWPAKEDIPKDVAVCVFSRCSYVDGRNKAIDECRAAFDKAQKEADPWIGAHSFDDVERNIVKQIRAEQKEAKTAYQLPSEEQLLNSLPMVHEYQRACPSDLAKIIRIGLELQQKEKDGAGNELEQLLSEMKSFCSGACGQDSLTAAIRDQTLVWKKKLALILNRLSPATRLPSEEISLGKAYIKGRNDEAFHMPTIAEIENAIIAECGVSSMKDLHNAAQAIRTLLEKG